MARVAEMTVDELKGLVREVTRQTVMEILADRDEGLELRGTRPNLTKSLIPYNHS